MAIDAKGLAIIDANVFVGKSLQDMKKAKSGLEFAIPPFFFDDLLSQRTHPRLGSRQQRVARVRKQLDEYTRRVALLDWPDMEGYASGINFTFFELRAPADLDTVFAEADSKLPAFRDEIMALYGRNRERWEGSISELGEDDLRRIREWAALRGEQRYVARLAAEWASPVFEFSDPIPTCDRVRLAQTSNRCRFSMLIALVAMREIGLSGNVFTVKPDRVVATWHDDIYALFGSLCGDLISDDKQVQQLYRTLREVPRHVSARLFADERTQSDGEGRSRT